MNDYWMDAKTKKMPPVKGNKFENHGIFFTILIPKVISKYCNFSKSYGNIFNAKREMGFGCSGFYETIKKALNPSSTSRVFF